MVLLVFKNTIYKYRIIILTLRFITEFPKKIVVILVQLHHICFVARFLAGPGVDIKVTEVVSRDAIIIARTD